MPFVKPINLEELEEFKHIDSGVLKKFADTFIIPGDIDSLIKACKRLHNLEACQLIDHPWTEWQLFCLLGDENALSIPHNQEKLSEIMHCLLYTSYF